MEEKAFAVIVTELGLAMIVPEKGGGLLLAVVPRKSSTLGEARSRAVSNLTPGVAVRSRGQRTGSREDAKPRRERRRGMRLRIDLAPFADVVHNWCHPDLFHSGPLNLSEETTERNRQAPVTVILSEGWWSGRERRISAQPVDLHQDLCGDPSRPPQPPPSRFQETLSVYAG